MSIVQLFSIAIYLIMQLSCHEVYNIFEFILTISLKFSMQVDWGYSVSLKDKA